MSVMDTPEDPLRPAAWVGVETSLPSALSPPSLQALQPRRWSSRALLGEQREVEIEHEGMVYRLRLTSLGKLILTK